MSSTEPKLIGKGRLYVCNDTTTGDVKFVRANSPSQSRNAWLGVRIEVRPARAEDMIGVNHDEILDALAVHPDQQPLL